MSAPDSPTSSPPSSAGSKRSRVVKLREEVVNAKPLLEIQADEEVERNKIAKDEAIELQKIIEEHDIDYIFTRNAARATQRDLDQKKAAEKERELEFERIRREQSLEKSWILSLKQQRSSKEASETMSRSGLEQKEESEFASILALNRITLLYPEVVENIIKAAEVFMMKSWKEKSDSNLTLKVYEQQARWISAIMEPNPKVSLSADSSVQAQFEFENILYNVLTSNFNASPEYSDNTIRKRIVSNLINDPNLFPYQPLREHLRENAKQLATVSTPSSSPSQATGIQQADSKTAVKNQR